MRREFIVRVIGTLLVVSQNKGYYAVQGYSRSSRSVTIESMNATSY